MADEKPTMVKVEASVPHERWREYQSRYVQVEESAVDSLPPRFALRSDRAAVAKAAQAEVARRRPSPWCLETGGGEARRRRRRSPHDDGDAAGTRARVAYGQDARTTRRK